MIGNLPLVVIGLVLALAWRSFEESKPETARRISRMFNLGRIFYYVCMVPVLVMLLLKWVRFPENDSDQAILIWPVFGVAVLLTRWLEPKFTSVRS